MRAKVDKLSADVRVEPRFLAQKPTDLSGGQKQRIAIARAFAGDPTLVVCDEPASALDVSVQASILNLLVELQTNEQVSYVFISHDLAVVRYISDRIGVMYLAELIEVGSADEVFNAPHHPYTEALLSSIPKLDFDTERQRIPLRGSMPSLSEPPSGCRFHTRCHRFLGDICVQQEPPSQEPAERTHLQVPHPARRAPGRPACDRGRAGDAGCRRAGSRRAQRLLATPARRLPGDGRRPGRSRAPRTPAPQQAGGAGPGDVPRLLFLDLALRVDERRQLLDHRDAVVDDHGVGVARDRGAIV